MVYNPTNRTTRYFAWWAAANAVAAVIIGVVAAGVEGSTRVIALVAAVLFAGIAAANLVALTKLRRSSTGPVTGQ